MKRPAVFLGCLSQEDSWAAICEVLLAESQRQLCLIEGTPNTFQAFLLIFQDIRLEKHLPILLAS